MGCETPDEIADHPSFGCFAIFSPHERLPILIPYILTLCTSHGYKYVTGDHRIRGSYLCRGHSQSLGCRRLVVFPNKPELVACNPLINVLHQYSRDTADRTDNGTGEKILGVFANAHLPMAISQSCNEWCLCNDFQVGEETLTE